MTKRRFHFIYKTTNVVTSKYYIGAHSTYDLTDGYCGSGRRLVSSVKKYGINAHKVEILEFLTTREELMMREKELVTLEMLKDKACMNIAVGGSGGWEIYNTDSVLQRIKGIRGNKSMNQRERDFPGWRREIAIRANRTKDLRGTRKPVSDKFKYAFRGKQHTLETRLKISSHHAFTGHAKGKQNPMYGTVTIFNRLLEKTTRIRREQLNIMLTQGWEAGSRFNWMKHRELEKIKLFKEQQKQQRLADEQLKRAQLENVDFSKPGWAHQVQRILSLNTYTGAKKFVSRIMPEVYKVAYVNTAMRRTKVTKKQNQC